MTRAEWIWMPHPAHFIAASNCRFHLATWVGGYVVSTVGEYVPDSAVREVLASSRGITLAGRGDAREYDWMKKAGYEKIGCDRLYETMVFKAQPAPADDGQACCPWRIDVSEEVDSAGYNDSESAARGHMELCEKWAKAVAS